MKRRTPPLPDDGIYRAILLVMVASVVIGAIVALIGEAVLHDETVSNTGAGIALVSGVVYFFFRWLERRETARRGEP